MITSGKISRINFNILPILPLVIMQILFFSFTHTTIHMSKGMTYYFSLFFLGVLGVLGGLSAVLCSKDSDLSQLAH